MAEVSVIMPVFNKAEYLAHGLQSILDQSFRDFELIIVNDGSTDDSLSVIKEFACADSRIVLFDVPNGGVSKARNIGLDYATGKYVTFIDADDYVASEYLKNMYDILCGSKVDMVISGVKKYWIDQHETVGMAGRFHGRKAIDEILPDFAETQKESGIYGTCVSKMYSKSLTDNIRFDETLKLAEDFDYYLRLYALVDYIYFDDKQYYFYLQEAENSTGKIADSQIDYFSQLQISLRYRNFLIRKSNFTQDNRRVLNEQITNYLYLSLFYCPNDMFSERFCVLQNIVQNEQLELIPSGYRQRIVIGLFRKKLGQLLSLAIRNYHAVRKLIRRVHND